MKHSHQIEEPFATALRDALMQIAYHQRHATDLCALIAKQAGLNHPVTLAPDGASLTWETEE
jgi:hypothetical protein